MFANFQANDLPCLEDLQKKKTSTDSDALSTLSTDFCELDRISDFAISIPSKNKKPVIDTTKFKTEMCKNFMDFGTCRYGKKCKFAHGRDEIHDKVVPNKQKYKSKECNTFFTCGYCPYGGRCLFRHDDRTENDFHLMPYSTLLSSISLPEQIQPRSRLQIFSSFGNNVDLPEEEKEYLYYMRIFRPASI